MHQQEQHHQVQDGDDDDLDWEEWDGSSPFWVHCVAGSLAGVVEHTAVYPLDTVRTHIQVCASCINRRPMSSTTTTTTSSSLFSSNVLRMHSPLKHATAAAAANGGATHGQLPVGMWQTIRYLVNEPALVDMAAARTTTNASPSSPAGISRLWRGVQTMLIGCIPAHALYFSSYEMVKSIFADAENGQLHTAGSLAAGAAATLSHDMIMTPMDTIKQRMQIGHYESVAAAVHAITRTEGWQALYRSFFVTLASNVPYGMIMVSTNEFCKSTWTSPDRPQWQTVLASSSMAGLVASAVTTPLDRIKTALQTQSLQPACFGKQAHCALQQQQQQHHHLNWRQAATHIWKQEGVQGFYRGMLPRVMSHTPAVAISWTTYETAKQYLIKHCS